MDKAEKVDGEELQDEVDINRLQKQALELLYFPPLMIHLALVLFAGWIASSLEFNLLFVFTLGFAYLCFIENRQRQKIEIRMRSDERKSADRKRLLSDAETARWLNNLVECVWPVFLEKFASEHFLMRLAPWFLEKYKPWTAKKVLLQRLYLGRSPPVFTLFRAGRNPTDGDHVVLEMNVSFSAARDMNASVAVQMRKRLGLGIWTSFQISNIQVEGKLKVGVRFTKGWPVIERLRICFSDAPIIRMVATPVFSYGVDVTDLPGIAAWLDKMIIDALEQSLVEPNMLVVDVEKLVSDSMLQPAKISSPDCSPAGDWFHVGKHGSVATVLLEILEAEKLKPSDPNGKADPYVKIVLGKTEFLTAIKRKTLYPSWHEQFRIPIPDWTLENFLLLRVRDKDRFLDDEMGYKRISIDDFKDGERHDMWLHLDGVKTGRLHVALTVEETLSVDETPNNSFDSSQFEDGQKGATTSSVAGSTREVHDNGRPETIGEVMGSDSDNCPLKDERQAVDVGVGQSGCVSIVSPGKHVVKEAHSSERLWQRRKSSKGNAERDMDPEISPHQGQDLDYMQLASTSHVEGQATRKPRGGHLWGRNQNHDVEEDMLEEDESGESCQDVNEVMVVGDKGSEVHTKLVVGEDGIENVEDLSLQNELPLVPESGELQGGNVDGSEKNYRHKVGRSSMKKMGKEVLKQAGKTAHNIGHVFKRFQSGKSDSGKSDPDSPQSLIPDSPRPTSLKQDETLASGQGERTLLETGSLDQCGQGMANEGENFEQTHRDYLNRDNHTSLKQNETHGLDEAFLTEDPGQGQSILSETGSLDQCRQDIANDGEQSGPTHKDEIKPGNQETGPSVANLQSPVHDKAVDEGDSHLLQNAVKEEDYSQPNALLLQYPGMNTPEGEDRDGQEKIVDIDSVKVPSPPIQSLQNFAVDNVPTPSVISQPPTREPPLPSPSPQLRDIARHGQALPRPEL